MKLGDVTRALFVAGLSLVASSGCCRAAAAEEVHVLPMPDVTPGKIETTDVGFVCSHVTKDRRRVRKADKAAAYAEYDVPSGDKRLYVIDHLVPLDLGGSNDLANLWPQEVAESKLKDRLERRLGELVCSGKADLLTIQREVADDWWAAYRKYVAAD